ncbi:MAG: AAA family ATPase [Butyribacter sp.]|uniref:AAA family ATPase n=1 Tax=Butyribacter sp. TaxID=2822465 RepID=UPI00399C729A
MKRVAIGKQSFEDIRKKDCFYIDKTDFIKDWWESADDVTLITRPRRFGKTLNMDMLKCFFSNQYEGRKELFEGLDIWKDEEYRELQGTYPVIFLSFADIKGNTFEMARQQICIKILDLYEENEYLLEGDMLGESEKAFYKSVSMDMSDAIISTSLNKLCVFMYKYYGKKVIIILDEYDTPMQEAYMNGYWDELVALTRSLFNSTFKTNPYLERGIMTGITRVSKESIFSDLNNLVVVTTTSNQYNTAFGFTEEEVFTALEEQEISDEKEKVKEWYDGFTFGNKKDIYNPWSIINYLKFKKYETYWADSSSNGLVNELIRTGSAEIKNTMETLMAGGIVEKNIDEQIVFEQLKTNKDAVWSLLLASGYLRIEEFRTEGRLNKKIYSLKLTNYEVEQMFGTMIERWFGGADVPYNEFINAMLSGDIESMNEYMNRVTRGVISYFDTGKTPSDEESERFYHGLVLGLMVDQVDNYILSSNRESGFGRYDIMLEPIDKNNEKYPGIVIEFKVFNQKKEDTLEETVENALRQIKEKDYDAELIKRGVKEENIYHYGFAFKGKEVLIDGR